MYKIAKRFKSVASGEVPLDDIEEFHTNDDDVDKFLYQSEVSLRGLYGLEGLVFLGLCWGNQNETFTVHSS